MRAVAATHIALTASRDRLPVFRIVDPIPLARTVLLLPVAGICSFSHFFSWIEHAALERHRTQTVLHEDRLGAYSDLPKLTGQDGVPQAVQIIGIPDMQPTLVYRADSRLVMHFTLHWRASY